MHLAACQAPDEPGVDSPETKFPGCGTLACFGHVVQNPFDFCCAEIGIDDEARALADEVCLAFRLQAVAVFRSAPVLPDDGVVDGLFGINVPHDGCLTLVGDADACDVESVDVDFRDGFGDDRSLGGPDLVRIVFHPARTGKILWKFTLRDGADFSFVIEQDGTRAAGALVER